MTVLANLGKNIRKLWQAVLDFIKGKGFKYDWTPLSDGFVNTVKKMPEYVQASRNGFDVVWKDWREEGEKLDKQWEQAWEKNAKKPAKAVKDQLRQAIKEGLPALQNIQEDKKKEKEAKDQAGKFTDPAQVWKQLQGAVLKAQEEKTLAIQKEQLKQQQQMAQGINRLANVAGGAKPADIAKQLDKQTQGKQEWPQELVFKAPADPNAQKSLAEQQKQTRFLEHMSKQKGLELKAP